MPSMREGDAVTCAAYENGLRCTRRNSHAGKHGNGFVSWVNISMDDEVRRLRAQNVDLKARIKAALGCIPRVGFDTNDDGEALHNYARVSAATIERVERHLRRPFRRPTKKGKR